MAALDGWAVRQSAADSAVEHPRGGRLVEGLRHLVGNRYADPLTRRMVTVSRCGKQGVQDLGGYELPIVERFMAVDVCADCLAAVKEGKR